MFLAQQPPTGLQHLLFVLPHARQVALRFQRLRQIVARRQGVGVSAEEARNAVSRAGMLGSTLEAFQRELESIALVM
jgi:hypothetical protein